MQQPTPEAISAFDAALPNDPRVERRKMFGMPAAFVGGNMFMGVFAGGVCLRLPAARVAALVGKEEDIVHFEPMEGRPWKDYAFVGAERWGSSDPIKAWAKEALEHTATLPPKEKKEKKAKKPAAEKKPRAKKS